MSSEAITLTWVPILIGEILFCKQEPGNNEDCFAVAGHQLLKILGTFNSKFWLAYQTLKQIINSLKGAESLGCRNFWESTVCILLAHIRMYVHTNEYNNLPLPT